MSTVRILVFSDSHGNTRNIIPALEAQTDARHALFLGDGAAKFMELASAFPNISFRAVSGNCDREDDLPLFRVLDIAGKRIYMTHGHGEGVKYSLGTLMKNALVNRADIVIYGHTHISRISYENSLHIINPGSVSQPRAGRPSYAVIDITAGGVAPFIVEL